MTRRIVIAGVLAVCLSSLSVGVIALSLVAQGARRLEERVLRTLSDRPAATLATSHYTLAQLSTLAGTPVAETPALAALGRLPALRPGYRSVRLAHRELLVYTRRLRIRPYLLSVAIGEAPARDALARLRRDVLLVTLAAAAVASALLAWLTQRALRPVRATASVADRIVRTGELDARVPERDGSDEIAALTRSINAMLAHLEASDHALRRFIGDASHELRTPLTTLAGNLELLATGQLDPATRALALADARQEAARLGDLIEAMLGLARAEQVSGEAVVDLAAVLSELSPQAIAEGPAPVRGDRVALAAMLRNLIDNAERYADGAQVAVAVDGDTVRVAVIDHGPGVAADERETIFGRFRRGRAGEGQPGSGLGLAIAAATASAHGGTVSVQETPGGGATFVVRLPRAN